MAFNENRISTISKEPGPALVSGSFDELWDKYAKFSAMDSAKMRIDQVVRYLFNYVYSMYRRWHEKEASDPKITV